ncbi:MAG: rhodanese-like domain-containing protein [Nanoarchaeota archaeon]|nr:rhodanese-like domain-containing protein [Nanoarchaeota archaeon]
MDHSINNTDFKEKLDSGDYILIDLRTPEETATGKINPDALERDFYNPNFKLMINVLKKDKKYLLYCAHANRSKITLKLMQDMGFIDVYELDKGISEYLF